MPRLRTALTFASVLALGCGGDDAGSGGAATGSSSTVTSSSSTGGPGGMGAAGGSSSGGGIGGGASGGGGSGAIGGAGGAPGGNGGQGGAGATGGTAGGGGVAGAGGAGAAGGGGIGGAGGGGGAGGSGGVIDVCAGSGDSVGTGGGGGGATVVVPVAGVVVSTLAGSATAGNANGLGDLAQFNNPVNVAIDAATGDVLVCDFDNGRIRHVTSAGDVTTWTIQANFERPFGITFTPNGNLYVETDINPLGQKGKQTGTIWGIDLVSYAATPVAANIGGPRGLAPLPSGEIVLSDGSNHQIRKLDPATATITDIAGMGGCPGYAEGNGTTARFNHPYGAVVTGAGDILVADQNNHRIRLVTLTGDVTTFAGDGVPGMVDGPVALARFDHPQDLAIDASGTVYVSDPGNHRIRRISGGIVETLAGDGTAGFQDGDGQQARFFGQEGLDVLADGTVLYVADGTVGEPVNPYNRIRKIVIP